jgi:hypothetical protein
MYHIVYLSFEEGENGRNYIGKRSTLDLNDGYLGSYTDNSFSPNSRIILGFYKTAEAAVEAEIQWQNVFDVARNPTFANKSLQRSSGFDTTGLRYSLKHKKLCPKKKPEECLKISLRMKNNNPMKQPEIAAKAMANRRKYTGSENPNSKLSHSSREIVRLMRKHFKKKVLASVFEVSEVSIKRIK